MEPLISVVITLVVLGLVLYLIENYIPLDPVIKTVIRVVVVLAVILWLLRVAGFWSGRFAF
jgi:uncharacterized membrane-anchored protein